MKLRNLTRAEYRDRPGQLLIRASRTLRCLAGARQLTIGLPWGFPITVDPRESIGRALVALSVLDLPVTETIWRLLDDGERAADIGANIGYMTAVMAARLRTRGEIWSFEPLPEMAEQLRAHLQGWRERTGAWLRPHAFALSDSDGRAMLRLPAAFADNRGTASLASAPDRDGAAILVETRRLDGLSGPDLRFDMVKVDVEGAEARVFGGAEQLLRSQRIRDLIFEEHAPVPTKSVALLLAHGYTVWRVARGPRGPLLLPPEAPVGDELDPPTFLASAAPDRVRERFLPAGWLALSQPR